MTVVDDEAVFQWQSELGARSMWCRANRDLRRIRLASLKFKLEPECLGWQRRINRVKRIEKVGLGPGVDLTARHRFDARSDRPFSGKKPAQREAPPAVQNRELDPRQRNALACVIADPEIPIQVLSEAVPLENGRLRHDARPDRSRTLLTLLTGVRARGGSSC